MASRSIAQFNATLFELTDEMMSTIKPSAMMSAGYAVFKNMYASTPDTDVVLLAFWEVAKDNRELIHARDTEAMVAVLRNVIPIPGVVDELWGMLSDENRKVVGDYVYVLYGMAAELQGPGTAPPPDPAAAEAPAPAAAASADGMHKMYNGVWLEFLGLLKEQDPKLGEGATKLAQLLRVKGEASSAVYGVLLPVMEGVLPRMAQESDMVALCLPPASADKALAKDAGQLGGKPFPFDRSVDMATLLRSIQTATPAVAKERLSTYWHYLKLFTVCVKECPPEVVAMMSQMAAVFSQAPPSAESATRLLREEHAVLTK
jgi:hypothetical protein